MILLFRAYEAISLLAICRACEVIFILVRMKLMLLLFAVLLCLCYDYLVVARAVLAVVLAALMNGNQ